MAIKTDSQGFLIGNRRLEQMSKGIVQTEDNTKQILNVLSESLKKLGPSIESGVRSGFERANRSGSSVSAGAQDSTTQAKQTRRTVDAANVAVKSAEQAVNSAEQAIDTALRTVNKTVPRLRKKSHDAASVESKPSQRTGTPERGADGRFIGKDGAAAGTASEKGFMRRMIGMLKGGMAVNSDVGGVDPTVDAVKELTSVVSPVGKVFFGMSAKAIGYLRGRVKKRRQDVPLAQEQDDANKDNARSNKERNRLLLRLIDAVRSSGGKGGGSGIGELLGGLLGGKSKGKGKVFGKLLKGLGKKIPFLGALLGGGMLASEWGSLDSKGKGRGIGELVGGGALGAIGGIFGGPAGAVAGGMLGSYLGGIFGEKISEWVDDLQKIDFGGIFEKAISAIKDISPAAAGGAFIPFSLPIMAAKAGAKAGGSIREWFSNTFGGGGASSGTTPYAGESFDYSSAPGNKNTAGNVATDRKARQLGMFNALRKAGFEDDRALALVGQIGRENDFSDKMFSTHIDPAKDKNGKDIKNGGVLSWNRERYDKFSAFMRERKLMDSNGNMPKTQEALDAQAAFIKQEMGSSDYKGKLGKIHDGVKRDPREYAAELARYIGWARGQKTIQGKNGRVAFDSAGQDAKANSYTDSAAELVKNQSDQIKADKSKADANAPKKMPAAKGKAKAPVIFKPNTPRPPAIKVPAITPDLIKIGKNASKPAVTAQSTTNIGQTVTDRGLAHVLSGGIGYNTHNA